MHALLIAILGAPQEATETFQEALRRENRTDHLGCDSVGALQRVQRLAQLMADDLTSTSKHFYGMGYLGIFSPVYNMTKVALIHEHVCRRALLQEVKNVCEVGFNAGESAMLFLEAAPTANLISFELGDKSKPWVRRAGARLSRVYGNRFTLKLGDSKATVPLYLEEHPTFRCDSSPV
ncbi:hypothetical protein AB1Y20_022666 [Prymnesium parvum]|uniref:Uncharacterized protein n=1 Tax=Prymnesium parvum TaxID=97485 RepID=A0AB34JIL0_PRYPA